MNGETAHPFARRQMIELQAVMQLIARFLGAAAGPTPDTVEVFRVWYALDALRAQQAIPSSVLALVMIELRAWASMEQDGVGGAADMAGAFMALRFALTGRIHRHPARSNAEEYMRRAWRFTRLLPGRYRLMRVIALRLYIPDEYRVAAERMMDLRGRTDVPASAFRYRLEENRRARISSTPSAD